MKAFIFLSLCAGCTFNTEDLTSESGPLELTYAEIDPRCEWHELEIEFDPAEFGAECTRLTVVDPSERRVSVAAPASCADAEQLSSCVVVRTSAEARFYGKRHGDELSNVVIEHVACDSGC